MPAPSALGSRAIIGAFYDALDIALGQSWVGGVSMEFTSDQESETYKWLGQTPAMREWLGGRLAKSLRANGITIANKTWESTLKLSVDDLRRDKTGQIMLRIGELADRAVAHDAKLLSTLIINGTGSTNGLCYDGDYFFGSAHAEGSSGTQVNLLTVSQVASLAIVDADAPTQIEMALAILNSIGYMLTWLDDQAEPVNENAREFMVMVPPNLFGAAAAAASQANLTGASGNVSSNPLLGNFRVTVVMNARLTTGTVFYIFRTDGRTKALIRQQEEGLSVQYLAEGSEQEILNNCHIYGVKKIGNAGYGMWNKAAHCTLSASG